MSLLLPSVLSASVARNAAFSFSRLAVAVARASVSSAMSVSSCAISCVGSCGV